jgi:hypothetical protein
MYIVSKLFDTNKVVVNFLSKFIDQDDFELLDPNKLFSMISTDKKTIGSKICFVHSPDFGITNFIMTEIDDILLGKIHEIFAD